MTSGSASSSSCNSPVFSTSTAGSDSQHGRWWRLVWCHERCNKQGLVESHRRESFSDASAIFGAELLLLRKAKNFEDWSCNPGTMPYVLVTDWREVKHCVASLQWRKPQARPVFTVVMVDSTRQYNRATKWAQLFVRHTVDLYICQPVTDLHAFVSGLFAQLNYFLKKEAMQTLLSLSTDRDAWPELRLQAQETCERRRWETCVHDHSSEQLQFGTMQSTLPARKEVDRVMQTVWECCPSHIHMERLLRDAMPETYDD